MTGREVEIVGAEKLASQLESKKSWSAFMPPEKEVTLKDLGRKMADFAADREWDQFHSPRNLLLALVGEVGELSEIFQWKGEVPRGLCDWNDAEKEHLGEELSDVLLYLVRLADVCNVNLGESALRKLQKNAVKYPVELCKGNSKKYRELAKKGTVRRNMNNTENIVFHERL
ncbi:hypothetical protein M758_10G138800 [Ceratodon purpureus]|nr:hypothetical protein M758_10G138800 [Ceratodon purpureus]